MPQSSGGSEGESSGESSGGSEGESEGESDRKGIPSLSLSLWTFGAGRTASALCAATGTGTGEGRAEGRAGAGMSGADNGACSVAMGPGQCGLQRLCVEAGVEAGVEYSVTRHKPVKTSSLMFVCDGLPWTMDPKSSRCET